MAGPIDEAAPEEPATGDAAPEEPAPQVEQGGAEEQSPPTETETGDVFDAALQESTPTVTAEGPSLVPPGEEELLEDRAVSPENVRMRPGRGLSVGSDDGMFGLSLGMRFQGRWTLMHEDSETEHELTIRRARLSVGGHAFSPDLRFKMQVALSPSDVGIRNNLEPGRATPTQSPMLDYYLELRHLRDLELRVGQFKVASNRQRVTSSGRLQLVERSSVNSEFNLDRDVGVELRSRDFLGADLLAYRAGIFSGRGRGARGSGPLHLMYIARVDVTPLGQFSDYSEADFERGQPRLAIGAGFALVHRGARDRGPRGSVPADGGTTTSRHLFVDALFKAAGFSALCELAWRDGDRTGGNAVDDMGAPVPVVAARNGYGVNLQAGYLMPGLPLEVAGRYAFVRGSSDSSLSDRNELVGGVSYYPGRHSYKLQIDYGRVWVDGFGEGGNRVQLQFQAVL